MWNKMMEQKEGRAGEGAPSPAEDQLPPRVTKSDTRRRCITRCHPRSGREGAAPVSGAGKGRVPISLGSRGRNPRKDSKIMSITAPSREFP